LRKVTPIRKSETAQLRLAHERLHAIDAETIELYVMGRLDNPEICDHLNTCEICEPRVAECRELIKQLKISLREMIDEKESETE